MDLLKWQPGQWNKEFRRRWKREQDKRVRRAISEQQNHRCCYCGVRTTLPGDPDFIVHADNTATIEHITALAHGGHIKADNVVMACHRCNRGRGLLDPYLFFEHGLWREENQTIRHSVTYLLRLQTSFKFTGEERVLRKFSQYCPLCCLPRQVTTTRCGNNHGGSNDRDQSSSERENLFAA